MKPITYTVEKKNFAMIALVAFLVVLMLIYSQPQPGITIIVAIVTTIFITVQLRWEYTHKVVIDTDNKQVIVVTKSRTNTVIDTMPFDEVHFTYKKRFDYYGGGMSRYGTKPPRDILQMECKQKTLAILVPWQDGWDNRMIMSLAKELAAAGVRQVVDKGNDNEIVIAAS
jgi:c-di-AMP phosphodiesterase-like protein